MILDRIIDPRDNLEKARGPELEHFAQANGVDEIEPGMPAQLMRRILRSKGLTNIAVPKRPLGAVSARPLPDALTEAPRGKTGDASMPEAEAVAEVAAEDDLARQWLGEKPDESPFERMSFAELRKECKRRGLHAARTDKTSDLRGKLSGQDTA